MDEAASFSCQVENEGILPSYEVAYYIAFRVLEACLNFKDQLHLHYLNMQNYELTIYVHHQKISQQDLLVYCFLDSTIVFLIYQFNPLRLDDRSHRFFFFFFLHYFFKVNRCHFNYHNPLKYFYQNFLHQSHLFFLNFHFNQVIKQDYTKVEYFLQNLVEHLLKYLIIIFVNSHFLKNFMVILNELNVYAY